MERQENMNNKREELEKQLLAYRRSLSSPPEIPNNNNGNSDENEDDVIFHVGTETVMRITAKKSVLARKNEVFHAMFYGSYSLRHRGSNSTTTSDVEQIYEPDVDGRAFKNLICYLNRGEVELRSWVTAGETLHAAVKYLCDGLIKTCAIYLAGQLNTDNVLQIYRRARFYAPSTVTDDSTIQPSAPSLDQIDNDHVHPSHTTTALNTPQPTAYHWCSFLVDCCLEFIDKNASAVLTSEEFEELDEEAVEQIVSRDGLRVYSELEVLTALVRWSVFECHRQQLDDRSENQRRVLDRLLWQVRFLVTPATLQLWETPVVAQLLTEEESSALLLAVQSSHGAHCSVDLLPDHIRAHWPQIGRPRNYLPVQGRPSPSESLGPHPSCRKSSCITEKIFVGLACIFE